MDKITFTAILEPIGGHHSSVIFIPEEILDTRPEYRVRAEGLINGIPFNLSPLSQKYGPKFFMVSATLRKQLKAQIGDTVLVIFEWVDANKLDLPEELEAVLAQDEDFNKLFSAFTVGKQRGLVHYINSAKTIDTRIKRSLEIAFKVKTNTLYSDKK